MKLFKKSRPRSSGDISLQDKIDSLSNDYNPKTLDNTFHKKKKKAIVKLQQLLQSTSRQNLQNANFSHVLICSLTLIYYFGMNLSVKRLNSKTHFRLRQNRTFNKAEAAYQQIMDLLLPERGDLTIDITLSFFTELSLWQYESFVVQMLEVMLYYNRGKMGLINALLTDIHVILFTDVMSARNRLRVLYVMLKSENLVFEKQKLLPIVTRLLDFIAKGANKRSAYVYVRKGFDICLRRIFERAQNHHRLVIITTMLNWFGMVRMSDDDMVEFSGLLDRAAELYEVGLYSDSFGDGLFTYILKNLISSPDTIFSFIGMRLLHRFLDRHHNGYNLEAPSIYFDFSQTRLVIGTYESSDKAFMRKHREVIHTSILQACKFHCNKDMHLKYIFIVICCIVLEVPCGLTAASAACLLMAIQDLALNGENMSPIYRYWMHAIVVSVMSLICWVHKCKVLYSYVNQIISRRAKEAPQLNPPLKSKYSCAAGQQHATWRKPTLFFEDWELRYGLWKHFSVQSTKKVMRKLDAKVPRIYEDF